MSGSNPVQRDLRGPPRSRHWRYALLALLAVTGVVAYVLSAGPGGGAPQVVVPTWALVSQAQKDEAARLKVPVAYEEGETGLRFVLIPGGSFQMGSPEGEAGRDSDEGPVHRVTVPPFYLSVYETTNGQYRRFKSEHVSAPYEDGGKSYGLDGDTQPAVRVSHADAEEFAVWLSRQGGGGAAYILPTEAQWEYAARAGTTTRFSFGDRDEDLPRYGNLSDKNDPSSWSRTDFDDGHDVTAPVGSYRPSPWGLYDMHGNVWEWCTDDYHHDYKGAPTDGRAWIDSPRAGTRVVRGGGWHVVAQHQRSAGRFLSAPSTRNGLLGFRLARPVTAR